MSTFERLRSGGQLNRQQRQEVRQRWHAAGPGLEVVHRDAGSFGAPRSCVSWDGARSINPKRFKVWRPVTRQGKPVMLWATLRKGIADLRRRAQIY